MKIALAQLNYHIGDFSANRTKITKTIKQAIKQNSDLIVFSELAICGYPPRDFLEFDTFIDQAAEEIEQLKPLSKHIGILIGAPTINPQAKGKRLFNSALFLYQEEIKQVFHKTLLPTYDVFDEYRYFESNNRFELLFFKGKKIAVTICEDIWNVWENDNDAFSRPLYRLTPMDKLIKLSPDFAINLSASPFNYRQAEIRQEMLKINAQTYNIPFIYVNTVGAQTELIFDGNSQVINSQGASVGACASFKEDLQFINTNTLDSQPTIAGTYCSTSKMHRIHDALILGIRDYFGKLGLSKAILGLSGGIDSALTLALATEALGAKQVQSLLLPSAFSSEHSIKDAIALCENLHTPYEVISIEKPFESIQSSMHAFFAHLPFDVTEENMQARLRGLLLMAWSNKFGHILLNTSNKSEMAVGYGTLYGDMCGGLSVIGDLYKTEVYALAQHINIDKEIIPQHTITKPPSAELRPNQKDADSLPDYTILDRILYAYIENRKPPKDIIQYGYDASTVEKVIKLVNRSEYKRFQTAPVLRVSSKAFGMGRRMPIVGKHIC